MLNDATILNENIVTEDITLVWYYYSQWPVTIWATIQFEEEGVWEVLHKKKNACHISHKELNWDIFIFKGHLFSFNSEYLITIIIIKILFFTASNSGTQLFVLLYKMLENDVRTWQITYFAQHINYKIFSISQNVIPIVEISLWQQQTHYLVPLYQLAIIIILGLVSRGQLVVHRNEL